MAVETANKPGIFWGALPDWEARALAKGMQKVFSGYRFTATPTLSLGEVFPGRSDVRIASPTRINNPVYANLQTFAQGYLAALREHCNPEKEIPYQG